MLYILWSTINIIVMDASRIYKIIIDWKFQPCFLTKNPSIQHIVVEWVIFGGSATSNCL